MCEKENIENIFMLKDKKIPTILTEFLTLASLPTGNREYSKWMWIINREITRKNI